MMEGFSTQLIVDADRTAQGWEVVVRFDAEDMQAAWSDLSDAQLRAHATILGEEIVEAILADETQRGGSR